MYSTESFLALPSDSTEHYPSISQGYSSSFLPGYLLGDNHSHHPPVFNSQHWSSSNSLVQKRFANSGPVIKAPSGLDLMRREWTGGRVPPVKDLYSSRTVHETAYTRSPEYSRTHSSPTLRKMTSSTSAPPTSGLFHTPGGSQENSSLQMMHQNQTVPVQNDLFFTQEDLSSDKVHNETWVTVFGFTPNATSFILQQFSQYGTILKHIVTPDCNWMHIHYSSKIQAKKALSNDGKIYGGYLKIGVTPCTEKSVMDERKSHPVRNMVMSSSDPSLDSPTHIRPLTAAYIAAKKDYEVLNGKSAPKRDGSLFSKIKDYMFGY